MVLIGKTFVFIGSIAIATAIFIEVELDRVGKEKGKLTISTLFFIAEAQSRGPTRGEGFGSTGRGSGKCAAFNYQGQIFYYIFPDCVSTDQLGRGHWRGL